jgi:N-methylhydantoinase B/oxoprolinase/acetone carboxylase alpha subunit
LAQAEHIPIHLGSFIGLIEAIMERVPLESVADGDTFVGNDAYTGGGTHLPDIVLATSARGLITESSLKAQADACHQTRIVRV